jgi:hypothetical protein
MKQKPKPAVAETTALVTVEAEEPECLVVIETGDPRWDRARKMWSECQASFWRTMEGMVMLGGELLDLRKSLGFEGSGGSRKSNTQVVGLQRTWSDWCETELQISDETSRRYLKCFEAIQARAKRIKDDSLPIHLLGTPAGELSDQDRNVLRTIITTLINGDSQQAMLLELRINQPKPVNGGDTSAARKAKLAKMNSAMAAELFQNAFASLTKGLSETLKFRKRQDLDKWLALLPWKPAGEFAGLLSYREETAALLANAVIDLKALIEKIDGAIDSAKAREAAEVKAASRKQPPTKR